jgi:tricorn protease
VYSVDWKGSERKRLSSPASVQHVTASGNRVVLSRSNGATVVSPEGSGAKTHGISRTIQIDLAEQAKQKFAEMARVLGESFYHPTMKDLDWPALTERYLNLAMQTRTASEFEHVGERFLGELNASHLGVSPPSPSSDLRQPAGRLGADLVALRQGDGTVHYRVEAIVPRGPQQNTEMELEPGDVITAIELEPIDQRGGIDAALKGRVGEETIVTVERTLAEDAGSPNAGETVSLDLLVTPISYGNEVNLRYDHWVEGSRAQVERMSDGRLGYLHIRSMGSASLGDFERDLFAAAYGKDGLVIDVRNNGGGWTTDRLLASLMVRPHSFTVPRGGEGTGYRGYPQDRLFIQRYTKPINVLINEKSFSNAEIFAHAIKTLRRGTLIGQQTYGGVISTGGFRLIDGTFVRLPFRGWYLENDAADMENNGAMPDLLVPSMPEAEAGGEDEQLAAAVRELMNRLETAQDAETDER